MIDFTENQRISIIKQLIPRNTTGRVLATTKHGANWLPANYRDCPAVAITVDNQERENEFSVSDLGLTFVTKIDGDSVWLCIPIGAIYYVEGEGGVSLMDYGNYPEPSPLRETAVKQVN